ncbi:ATP-binding cassette domain-containing protein [Heliobacterium gestii]|uniref:ATP-binding cassette domain-containing protein n=1 Tax=Heliomicrobium gestii TaxID=2699 RepID=A0A845LIG6_HELGE|nr:ABC transporter ATP-binding protein [Heliomicrobium gestii]MBM7868113.1 ABC-2 type transport system ATP-binding protein [Heliomicrobium gestii]MZP44359.1 ATP-binding cassette domain-containing protein [Heliomicrobium gestii]
MISITNVTKRYADGTVSVKDLNLHIAPGEFFGLLGPNGAGKTTTIRMLVALLAPTEGQIRLNGHAVRPEQVAFKADIGLVPQHINLEPELTVEQNLYLHGLLYSLPQERIRRRIEELIDFIEMQEKRHSPVNKLSGGMKRKVLIARALMHEPKIILLDEPTVGLDVHSRRKVWDVIKALNAKGITMVLTTHYLEEAETLCSRIGLLNKGRLILEGTTEELKRRVGEIVVERFVHDKTEVYLFPSQAEALAFAQTVQAGTISIRKAKLEDIFVKLTEETK